MFFTITLYSKNLNSLIKFKNFFIKNFIFEKLKFYFSKIKYNKPVKKKLFTVLKSPHVNKKAQEQFEYRIYSQKFVCFTKQPFLLLLIFKKLTFNSFSDIFISISLEVSQYKSMKYLKNNLNLESFEIECVKKDLLGYLKIMETFGEFVTNKIIK